jgi:hypothetical protein
LVFIAIIAIRCKADAKSALAFGVGYALDGDWVVWVVAGCEGDGQCVIMWVREQFALAGGGEGPGYSIPETFGTIQ